MILTYLYHNTGKKLFAKNGGKAPFIRVKLDLFKKYVMKYGLKEEMSIEDM